MLVANLTRYDVKSEYDYHGNDLTVSKDANGEFVKFEEAMEASSNSLQQLKAEIASLCDEMEGACWPDHYGMHIETFLSKLRQLSAV